MPICTSSREPAIVTRPTSWRTSSAGYTRTVHQTVLDAPLPPPSGCRSASGSGTDQIQPVTSGHVASPGVTSGQHLVGPDRRHPASYAPHPEGEGYETVRTSPPDLSASPLLIEKSQTHR